MMMFRGSLGIWVCQVVMVYRGPPGILVC